MSAQAATNASAEASADAAALLQFRALLLLRAPAEVLDARVRGHHRVSDTLRRLRASPLARDPTYMETAAAAQGALACWHALWARDRLDKRRGTTSTPSAHGARGGTGTPYTTACGSARPTVDVARPLHPGGCGTTRRRRRTSTPTCSTGPS